MNYCHPCQRHLNGALACPGCGAPAETYAAPVAVEPAVAAEVPPESGESEGEAERADPDGVEGGARAGAVTASRRDRKAAAHRRRRRRTLFVVTGFVLAAGGLSLAELGVDASVLPGFSTPGPAAEEDDGQSGDGEPASDPEETAGPANATPGAATSTASPDASESASPSASADDEEPEPDPTETEGPQQPPQATEEGGAGGAGGNTGADGGTGASNPPPPEASRPADPPSADPTPPHPDPAPTPTRKCDRFLWWCT